MKALSALALSVAVFCAVCPPARAASYDDFNAGLAAYINGDFSTCIRYFSDALMPGDLPKHLMHIAYYDRGECYRGSGKAGEEFADLQSALKEKPDFVPALLGTGDVFARRGDTAQAMAYYSEVIRLDEFNANVYFHRSNVYIGQQKYDQAIAELNEMAKLQDNSSSLFRSKAIVEWIAGRYAAASTSMNQAIKLRTGDPYSILWLYLATFKTDADTRALASMARTYKGDKWPRPIIDLYRGAGTPEDVFRLAKEGDEKDRRGQLCEANFYVAEWRLAMMETQAAKPMLDMAAAECPENFVEKFPAQIEAGRLP